ncbi:MAG: hypothetical protein ACOZDY_12910 [Pseudomonadota bacterium]
MLQPILAVALMAALTGCAHAHRGGAAVQVTIYDRTQGRELPVYHHRGRQYVAGTPGHEYEVRLRNRSGARVLTVISVDGVNAITGETAAASQSGYVLDPGRRAAISGWRKSLENVAAFYFTALPDSYAARTDRPDNVGVIGVAVFREKERAPEPWVGRDEAARQPGRAEAPAPSAKAQAESATGEAAREKRLGTGHGREHPAPTRYVAFERESDRPARTIALYYDSHANLVAAGVIPSPRPLPQPRPFPAGFVPDPPR